MTTDTKTTTIDPGRAALEAAAPELLELEQLQERVAEMVARHRRQPPARFQQPFDGGGLMFETAAAALDIIATGGDPDAEIESVALDLARVDLPANEIWARVELLLQARITELMKSSTEGQIRHLHEQLVDLVDEARAAAAAGADLAGFEDRYAAIRTAYQAALRRGCDDLPPTPDQLRLWWLRNIDRFEVQHQADVAGSPRGIDPDPWGTDHGSRLRFMVDTPSAVPWCPTERQIAAKAAEMRAEVEAAAAERNGGTRDKRAVVVRTERVPAEPDQAPPAAMTETASRTR